MYLLNKYTRCYFSIIERARTRTLEGYSEKHHIIPRSLGGSDRKDNLVKLTAREHFICHLLLVKMVVGDSKYKMARAATWFKRHPNMVNSRTYSFLKELVAEDQSKRRKGKSSWNKGLIGQTQSEEAKSRRKENWERRRQEGYNFDKMSGKGTKKAPSLTRAENISKAMKGKPKSPEHIQKIKDVKKNISPETREKMRQSALRRKTKILD
jgi:hypothetical protein